jgi:hypothetical protein
MLTKEAIVFILSNVANYCNNNEHFNYAQESELSENRKSGCIVRIY